MSRDSDHEQPLDPKQSKSGITRRDFVGHTLVGSGFALLSAASPLTVMGEDKGASPYTSGRTIPLPLNNLDKSWTGPGGIGDYATANGNTHSVVNAAHTLRNTDLEEEVARAEATGEQYDLVVVGGGFAGFSAAYQVLRKKPEARILILDNHDMFGGEARHNEFEVDGYRLWAPQGSTGAVWPLDAARRTGMYHEIWGELNLPTEFEWQSSSQSDLKIPRDNYSPMHLTWEDTDLGWHFPDQAMVTNPWQDRFSETPLDEQARNDLIWMETFRQPPEREDWAQWLDSMTYSDFLSNEMGIKSPFIEKYLAPFGAAMGMGLGPDVISAYQAFNFLQPGVMQYLRYEGLGDITDYIHLAQWPGGNTGTLRHIARKLNPDLFWNSDSLMDILTGPINWNVIDEPGRPVRIRLGSLVVNVVHDDQPERASNLTVTYLNEGAMRSVKARHVVMAGQQHLNKRVVADLPAKHREAMDQFMHAPMMVINVALRNWKFMDNLGVASVRWFDDDLGWFLTLRRQMIIDGEEPMPLEPDKPVVVTMYNSFCLPGLPIEEQTVNARMKMFGMTYAEIEQKVREQFTAMFGPGGFDADRDIAGIIVNRQGHAYVATPPGFFFGKDGKPAPSDVIREPHGRIAFAHAELMGMQMWEGAVQEGERAGDQVLAMMG